MRLASPPRPIPPRLRGVEPTRPGYQTTEFWTAFTGQLLALLTILGILQGPEAVTLQAAVSKCVAATCMLLSNAWVVVRYIPSRTALNQGRTKAPAAPP